MDHFQTARKTGNSNCRQAGVLIVADQKKGRDLFDLWHALDTNQATPSVIIACLKRYMSESGQAVSRAQFEENLAGKRNRHDFREDIEPLLRPGVTWDFDVAMNTVLERIIAELPGDPWKGPSE